MNVLWYPQSWQTVPFGLQRGLYQSFPLKVQGRWIRKWVWDFSINNPLFIFRYWYAPWRILSLIGSYEWLQNSYFDFCFFSPKTDPIHNQMKVKQHLQDLDRLGLQYEYQHQLCGFVFPAAGSIPWLFDISDAFTSDAILFFPPGILPLH